VSRRRRPDFGAKPEKSIWFITFADLSSLLLAFFLLLYSMSTLELDKWKAAASRMTKGDPSAVQLRPAPVSAQSVPTVDVPPALPLGYLGQVLEQKIRQETALGDVRVHRLDKLLVVSLPADALFLPDQAVLSATARAALFRISSAIAQVGNQIDVQGHTAPAASPATGTAWQWRLSLERAVAVADELRRIGYQRNPAILGLGDSRFRFLDPAIPEKRRLELARRVDLVIHPTEGES
jgi:chemotaxis protein MotB